MYFNVEGAGGSAACENVRDSVARSSVLIAKRRTNLVIDPLYVCELRTKKKDFSKLVTQRYVVM